MNQPARQEIDRPPAAALPAEVVVSRPSDAPDLQAERLALVAAMTAKVAHDIRNPLGSITLNLDLMSCEIDRLTENGQNSPAEGQALIAEMRAEAGRIERILAGYLQIAHQPRLRLRPLDLNSLLREKLATVSGELEPAGIRLRAQFEPSADFIEGDADQLWRAIFNLIQNSREALPEGGEIVVEVSRSGDCAVIRVSDSGGGIPSGQMPRLFEPFFTTKIQGAGLGLAVAQQIITGHGGTIECESAPETGAVFAISLPLAENLPAVPCPSTTPDLKYVQITPEQDHPHS